MSTFLFRVRNGRRAPRLDPIHSSRRVCPFFRRNASCAKKPAHQEEIAMKWLAALLLMMAFAPKASAQTAPCPPEAAPGDTARPMIRLEASARADSLRLNAPSSAQATVRPCNRPGAVRVERENLPNPAQPGVTYRNVGVRVRITADPAIACRLAAALADSTAACAP